MPLNQETLGKRIPDNVSISGGARLPSVTTLLPVSTVYSDSRPETDQVKNSIIPTFFYIFSLFAPGDDTAAGSSAWSRGSQPGGAPALRGQSRSEPSPVIRVC